MPTRRYIPQVELPVTFGLGMADMVDRLRTVWPDGREQELVPEAMDTTLVIGQPTIRAE